MRFLYFLLPSLLLLQMTALEARKEATIDPAWETMVFSIEDTHAFVGIAPVYLEVSELKPENGKLIGTYTIKVPLKSSKNDHGKIVLPLNVSVSELGEKGGKLRGKAISKKNAESVNLIVCEILPKKDQAVSLAITTNNRTITFKSRYTITESSKTKSDS